MPAIPTLTIPRIPNDLREIQERGMGTRDQIVSWVNCRSLWSHGIVACGVSELGRGFRSVQRDASISVVMVCTRGAGRALVGGRFRAFGTGHAYLMPLHALRGHHSVGRRAWRVCWVCYIKQAPDHAPIVTAREPTLVRCDPRPLEAAVAALYREMIGANDPNVLHHCGALVDLFARRAMGTAARDDERLWPVWQRVDAELHRRWTLASLADLAGLSVEGLRLVCQREIGRTPMAQVTELRMQRAQALLASGDTKVAAVAAAVGYGNAFAFSTAFRRHHGQSPAAYRERRGGERVDSW